MLYYLGFTWLVLIGRIPSICWITCMLQNTKQNKILVMHEYMATKWEQWTNICITAVQMFEIRRVVFFFKFLLYITNSLSV